MSLLPLKRSIYLPISLLLSGSAAVVIALVIALGQQRPACGCAVDTKGYWLGTIQRMQQVAHFETGSFLDAEAIAHALNHSSIAEIGKHHRYSAEVISNDSEASPAAIIYATPYQSYFQPTLGPIKGRRQPIYHSAVSAIAFDPATDTYSTITCHSTEPAEQPLLAPTRTSNQFLCPSGSTQAD